MIRWGLLAAVLMLGCAAPAPEPAPSDPELARLRTFVDTIHRKPFRWDDETAKAVDGLCALAGRTAGFEALRRQYAFLEGVEAGTSRVEDCFIQASSQAVAQESAWAWYEDLTREIDDAKSERPSFISRLGGEGAATVYDQDKPRYQRLERLASALKRLLPPARVERREERRLMEEAVTERDKLSADVTQAVRDYLVETGRLGARELARLDQGEGSLRVDVRWREGAVPAAADVGVEAFLPFRASPVPGTANAGPSSIELTLTARQEGPRWAVGER